MKALHMSLVACALAAFAGTGFASSGSLVSFKPAVMPVVVQVNTEGKVTSILPAMHLSREYRQLLVKQLDAWIVKPVFVKGHPVASRFIIEVGMRTQPRTDGKYNASFVYVRSLPIPYGGPVHWNVIDGGLRLALVPNVLMFPGQRATGVTNAWSGPTMRDAGIYDAASGAPTMRAAAAAVTPVERPAAARNLGAATSDKR